MTEYQQIVTQRRIDSMLKILQVMNEPMLMEDIATAAGLRESHAHQLCYRMPKNIRIVGKAKNSSGRASNLYTRTSLEIINDVIPDEKVIGQVYTLMDDARYHDNMRLLRENRKSGKVFVSGTSLSGF